MLTKIINITNRVKIRIFHKNVKLKKCKIRRTKFFINGKNNYVYIGNNVNLKNARIIMNGYGNHLTIQNGCNIEGVKLILDGNSKLDIGEKVEISYSTEIAIAHNTQIIIGKDTIISKEVQLRTSDMHTILNGKEVVNKPKNIIISDHCWICQNAIILKGVDLPKGTIVGAGAVVTRGFDKSNIVLCGNPAKIVRQDIEWRLDEPINTLEN